MNPKKKILILCDWFLPGYLAGGPIQSIAALTEHLKENFDFYIVTTDRDFKSKEPYPEVKINQWTQFEGRQVYYLSPDQLNKNTIAEIINSINHDVLYLNSMYSKPFTIFPLQLKKEGRIKSKIVLAPRGMLSDGALKTKKLKKKLFLVYAKVSGLLRDVIWQSTSHQETGEIKKQINTRIKLVQVSNLPNIPPYYPLLKEPGHLKVCYVGRLCDTKNVKFTFQVLSQIKTGNVSFDVYGPVEDAEYWQMCLKIASDFPSNIKFQYHGSMHPKQIQQVLAKYHVLFLPSYNENFGHAMVEALLAHRPILISDQTPWRNLKQHGAGNDLPLDAPEQFVKELEHLLDMGNEEYQALSASAHQYISEKLNIDQIKEGYRLLFNA